MKKIQIRQGVFETNSSSTHSMTICSKEDYEKLTNGEFLIDWYGTLVSNTQENIENEEIKDLNTYLEDEYLESFVTNYTTKSGDEIVIFGKYGRDG